VLRPQDQAFIIGFGRSATLLQDTTGSVQELQNGLDELGPDRFVAIPPEVVMAQFPGAPRFPMPRPPPQRRPGPGRGKGGVIQMGGTVLYDAVFLASDEVLKPTIGRKAIILITDGQDQGSRVTLARALEASQRSDVIIYSIQVRSAMGRIVEPLNQLSTETGGRVHRLDGNLDKIFAEIGDELRSQYSLSYSSATGSDGSYHAIEVQMVNKNLKTQARKGYYAR
jgi:VWFA-related protein